MPDFEVRLGYRQSAVALGATEAFFAEGHENAIHTDVDKLTENSQTGLLAKAQNAPTTFTMDEVQLLVREGERILAGET